MEDVDGSTISPERVWVCSCLPTVIDDDSRRDGRCYGEVGGVVEHVKKRRELAHIRLCVGIRAAWLHKKVEEEYSGEVAWEMGRWRWSAQAMRAGVA